MTITSPKRSTFALNRLLGALACAMPSLLLLSQAHAGAKDDPIVSMVKIDQLEAGFSDDENPLTLEGKAWIGRDFDKLALKVEAERADGETEEAELQGLYSKAIAPYWDFQVGVRNDFQPTPSRSWAVIGFEGVAPYLFEVDTALFIGESGRTALRLEAEYEFLFTQQLVLSPEIEVNFHGQNDEEIGVGSGLSNAEFGLRLRYEFRREFAPYIGVNWSKMFGNTAKFHREEGSDTTDTQIVLGIRAWF